MGLTREEILKREFLHCYHQQMGNKIAACKILNIKPSEVSAWIETDEIFKEAFEQVETDLIFTVDEMVNEAVGTKEEALVDFSDAKATEYAAVPIPATIAKMNAFLKIYPQVGWDVRAAAETLGITVSSVSRWRRTYPNFADAMERCMDEAIDFAESRMFKMMEKEDRVAALMVMFFLKTKGKKRGYTEGGRDGNEVPVGLQAKETQDAIVNAAKKALAAPKIAIVANEDDCKDEKDAINVS